LDMRLHSSTNLLPTSLKDSRGSGGGGKAEEE